MELLTPEILAEVAEFNAINNNEDVAYIEAKITKHFDKYDEVFRNLA